MRPAVTSPFSIDKKSPAEPLQTRVFQQHRSLWVSPDHGAAQASRLEGGQRPGGAYLASRGAQGSAEAEATRTAVAQRWFVRAAPADASQPCVELRLRRAMMARRMR